MFRAPRLRRCALPVLFALVQVACTASRTSAPDAVTGIVRVDESVRIDGGVTRVAIDNPYGEINLRSRDEREVGIHAVVQRLAPRARMKLVRTREGDTLRIAVTFEGAATDAGAPGRADIAVFMPGELAVALSTRDARIAAKRRPGPIEATTQSGEIHASSLGRLTLHSGSGQIRAMAIGKRWPGASDIATDSGRIVLLVPTFGDIALEARTAGRLTTGFGLSVHTLADGTHEAHARYGAGTSMLRVHSTSGEIVLEQLVLLGDDKGLPEDED